MKLTVRDGVSAEDVFAVECPFVRETVSLLGPDGPYEAKTWRPGIVWEPDADCGEGAYARAHGLGKVTYTVVSVHRLPAPWPARVFFTRRWTDPEGHEFGKSRLFVMTRAQFTRRTRGYVPAGAYDGYVVSDITPAGRDALAQHNGDGE